MAAQPGEHSNASLSRLHAATEPSAWKEGIASENNAVIGDTRLTWSAKFPLQRPAITRYEPRSKRLFAARLILFRVAMTCDRARVHRGDAAEAAALEVRVRTPSVECLDNAAAISLTSVSASDCEEHQKFFRSWPLSHMATPYGPWVRRGISIMNTSIILPLRNQETAGWLLLW
jgi:hypothetical protein